MVYSDYTRPSIGVQTSRECSDDSLAPVRITRSRPFVNRVEYMVQMLVLKLCKGEPVRSAPSKALRDDDVRRRESKKRLRRAQMARALSNKNRKQFRRRLGNRGRSNRHIYTNKDMKM